MTNQIYLQNVDDDSIRHSLYNCVVKQVGTTIGRFIFTNWAPMVYAEKGKNIQLIGCVFLGHPESLAAAIQVNH